MCQTISSGKEWQGEFCNKTKQGRQFWELCSIAPIKDEAGAVTNFVAIKKDITGYRFVGSGVQISENITIVIILVYWARTLINIVPTQQAVREPPNAD